MSNYSVFLRFHKHVYVFVFFLILLVKLFFFALVYYTGNQFFGGGNDSNYYHAYAQGLDNVVVNIWPVILRWLNDIGWYSREGVGLFLKFLVVLVIPLLVARLAFVKDSPLCGKAFWMLACVVSAYPTLVYLATDIYRDVFMLFIWSLGLFVYKWIFETRLLRRKIIYFLLGLGFSLVLYEFRPYLGLGYLGALLFSGFYRFSRHHFLVTMLLWASGLFVLYMLGLLEPILRYRNMFLDGTLQGGSNIGIEFSSTASFLPDFWQSLIYQLAGVFFVNLPTVIVFVVESVLFLLALIYVFQNKRYADKFVNCLLVFFIAYSSIWLLGNDNMGSATRLRMFNYVSVYLAFFIVLQNKYKAELQLISGRSASNEIIQPTVPSACSLG